ncbi:MAG TPA: hypothetical protein VFQ96_05580, partial [Microbacteriaceae bacterium]|nr:hypothetical protein [Microbacteriaceae bacterium]
PAATAVFTPPPAVEALRVVFETVFLVAAAPFRAEDDPADFALTAVVAESTAVAAPFRCASFSAEAPDVACAASGAARRCERAGALAFRVATFAAADAAVPVEAASGSDTAVAWETESAFIARVAM